MDSFLQTGQSFEQLTDQQKSEQLEQLENLIEQAENIKASIAQNLSMISVLLENLAVYRRNLATPSNESLPQSEELQQEQILFSSIDSNGSLVYGPKLPTNLEKENEEEVETMPVDLSNKKNTVLLVGSSNIELSTLAVNVNQTQQNEKNFPNSNSHSEELGQQRQTTQNVVLETAKSLSVPSISDLEILNFNLQMARERARHSNENPVSENDTTLLSSNEQQNTNNSTESSLQTIHENKPGSEIDDVALNAENSQIKIFKKSLNEALALPRSNSTSTSAQGSSSSGREKRLGSSSRSASSSLERHCRKKIKTTRSSSRGNQSNSGFDSESSKSLDDKRHLKFYDQFIVKKLYCSQYGCFEKVQNEQEFHCHLQEIHCFLPYKCPLYECPSRCSTR